MGFSISLMYLSAVTLTPSCTGMRGLFQVLDTAVCLCCPYHDTCWLLLPGDRLIFIEYAFCTCTDDQVILRVVSRLNCEDFLFRENDLTRARATSKLFKQDLTSFPFLRHLIFSKTVAFDSAERGHLQVFMDESSHRYRRNTGFGSRLSKRTFSWIPRYLGIDALHQVLSAAGSRTTTSRLVINL